MEENGPEILKVRMENIQLKDLISEELQEEFKEKMDMELRIPSMMFAVEEGVIYARHPTSEMEEEATLEIEANNEENIDNFCEFIEIIEEE